MNQYVKASTHSKFLANVVTTRCMMRKTMYMYLTTLVQVSISDGNSGVVKSPNLKPRIQD